MQDIIKDGSQLSGCMLRISQVNILEDTVVLAIRILWVHLHGCSINTLFDELHLKGLGVATEDNMSGCITEQLEVTCDNSCREDRGRQLENRRGHGLSFDNLEGALRFVLLPIKGLICEARGWHVNDDL